MHTQQCAPSMSRRSSACAVLVALARTLLGHAAIAAEPVRLVYSAPATCPDEETFLQAVRARTTEAQFISDRARATRTFVVSLRASEARTAGTLQVIDGQARSAERRFEAADCAQVVSALALLTALTIDPNASMDESPGSIGAPPAATVVAPAEVAPAPTPAVAAPAGVRPRWRFAMGLGVTLETGIFPAVAVAPQLFGDVAREPHGPWSPSFRAGVLYAETGVVSPASPAARYVWGAVRLEGCPVRLAFAANRVEIRPCGVVDVGVLWAEGTEVAVPVPATRPWFAAGAAASRNQGATGEAYRQNAGGP